MYDLQKRIDEIIAESQRIQNEIDLKLKSIENQIFIRLDFYADSYGYKNKRFSFKCLTEDKAYKLLSYYIACDNKIRACYINKFQWLYGKYIIVDSRKIDIDLFKSQFSS